MPNDHVSKSRGSCGRQTNKVARSIWRQMAVCHQTFENCLVNGWNPGILSSVLRSKEYGVKTRQYYLLAILTALVLASHCLFAAPALLKTDIVPELFAPGVISTTMDETAGTFTPDGRSFYFVRRAAYTTTPAIAIICVSYLRDGKWGPAEVVPFSGTYLDSSPFVSPDGNRIYFASKRPTQGAPKAKDWNIFYVQHTESGWSDPSEIGSPINGPGNDTNPALTADGTIYFVSDRDGQPGQYHIYCSALKNGRYETPKKLGPEINAGEADINPYIASDERILVFASYRKDALLAGRAQVAYPRADLYISVKRDGRWTQARRLEHAINTTAAEGNPSISPDGKWFYFTSERSLFQVPVRPKLTTAEWEKHVTSIENGVGNVYRTAIESLDVSR